ncbi:mucin-5AC-like [Paramacrobiotus metropolitanus]|uniref:mucin-5AC-like n=1 Tax=Paramacrobiotus metropolitanus TaxID=2943436 RepID=UPI00244608C0|nr:mucin-5AC-like [Paramacrobiotus metropolitanus]
MAPQIVLLLLLRSLFVYATTNSNPDYSRWDKSRIPYCIDPQMTSTETTAINAAIALLSGTTGGMKSCITFTAVPCTSTTDFKIRFTIPTGTGVSAYSSSMPGRWVRAPSTTAEQPVYLARDATACSTTARCILRYIVNSLGKRNEHERGDRDSFITVAPDSQLSVPAAYRKYNQSEAYWGYYAYDYCSITHNQPADFATTGNAFTMTTITTTPGCIPKLNMISATDCQWLNIMYQCNIACDASNLYVAQCTTSQCTGTGGTGTGGTGTTTPCTVNFCATPTPAINEASVLFNNKYYVFSGTCMIEVDATTKMVTPTNTNGVTINSILVGVTGPVAAVWTDQMSGTTFVQTQAGQFYSCVGATTATTATCTQVTQGRPATITPYTANDLEFEWSGTGTGPYAIYRYSNTAKQYVNEYSQQQKAPTTGTGVTATISGNWLGAYLVKTGAGTTPNAVNVIGLDSSSNTVVQQMTYTGTADTFQWAGTSQPFATALGCSGTSGGTGTTTPCSVNFCSNPPPTINEASILYNGKYYMFSGTCMVEVDRTNKLVTAVNPANGVSITSMLVGVTGPVAAVWTDQMTQTTYVQTQSSQFYACTATSATATSATCSQVASGRPPTITGYGPTDLEFEWAQSSTGPYAIYRWSNTGKQYVNEYTQQQKAPATATGITATITGNWNAAYMVRSDGSGTAQNTVNVIGVDGTGVQYVQQMTSTAADTFQWSAAAVPLGTALACPTGSG